MLLFALVSGLKIGLIMLTVGAILMGAITSMRKLVKKNKKAFLIYSICALILFGLIGLLSNDRVLENSPLGNFISFQILFLIIGAVHVWALRSFFKGIYEKPTDIWAELLYTVIITVIGLAAFVTVTQIFKTDYTFTFTAASICFILPFMIVKVYEYSISVPVAVYKSWTYPANENIKDPSSQEMKNPRVISFEFKKTNSNKSITNFKLKAPEQMELGKLFYFFVNDYNERHPEEQISYVDKENNPSKWIFYSKPNWKGARIYYDFSKTIDVNDIEENNVIICKRL